MGYRPGRKQRLPLRGLPGSQVSSWLNFTPLSLSPLAWYDASDTSTITELSNKVSQWDDKSGNGYNLTQATGALQPSSGTRTQNDLNVIDFTTTGLILSSTAVTISQPFSICMVWKYDSPNQSGLTRFTLSLSNAGTVFGPYIGDARWRIFSGTVLQGAVGSGDLNPHVACGIHNGSVSQVRIDSKIIAEGASGAANGSIISLGYSTLGFDGFVGEFFIVNRVMTESEMLISENYLKRKWGILP